MRILSIIGLALSFVVSVHVTGAPSVSTNYTLNPTSLDPGGEALSGDYSLTSGTLGLINGASSSGSYSIRHGYSGGLIPDIEVEQPTTTLTSGASTVDFGIAIGSASIDRIFVIRNTGGINLDDLVLQVTGDHASDFTASSLAQTSLAANESMQITVSFVASTTGMRSASLGISSNDPDESPFLIALEGTGIPDSNINDWKDGFGLSAVDTLSDGDHDLIDLLSEYGFNLDPTSNDSHVLTPETGTSGLPSIRLTDAAGTYRLEVEYIRRRGDVNLRYTVQFGSGLKQVDLLNASGTETVSVIDDSWERVLIQDTEAASSQVKRFGRIKLELLP